MATATTPKAPRLLRRPDVEAATGLKRSTIYKMMADGAFPKAVQLSPGCVAWREADVHDWIESRQTAA